MEYSGLMWSEAKQDFLSKRKSQLYLVRSTAYYTVWCDVSGIRWSAEHSTLIVQKRQVHLTEMQPHATLFDVTWAELSETLYFVRKTKQKQTWLKHCGTLFDLMWAELSETPYFVREENNNNNHPRTPPPPPKKKRERERKKKKKKKKKRRRRRRRSYAWLKRNIVVHCLIWREQVEVKHSTSTLSGQKRQSHLNATL